MPFDIDRLQEQLCDSLCGEVKLRKTRQGFIQVVTPFAFSDGDNFQLYLEEMPGGALRLTDYGHTFMHLSYDNDLTKFKEGSRAKLYGQLLAESSVRDEGGQLQLDASLENLGTKILRFGQAITRIYDLTYLNRSRVASTFYEDLAEMMQSMVDGEKIARNYNVPNQSNAQDYVIDYRLPGRREENLFVMGIPSRDKARLTTIILEHWLRLDVKFDSLLIFHDQQEIPRPDLARLSNAGGEMVASLDAADDLKRKLLKLAA